MRLRKNVAPPVRYEDDEVVESRSKNPTKPAFPRILKQQAHPFDRSHKPAAFPSLPLNSPTEAATSASTAPPDPFECATMKDVVQSPDGSEIDWMHGNGICKTGSEQGAAKPVPWEAAAREILYDQTSMESSPEPDDTQAEDNPNITWSSLDLSVRFRIFVSLCQNYHPDVAAHLLQLTQPELKDIQEAIRLRQDHPASVDQIWHYAARVSDSSGTYISPCIFKQYLDYMILASSYEYAFESQLDRGERFLQQLELDSAILGIWIPDPEGSIYMRDVSEFMLPVRVLRETSVPDSGYLSASDYGDNLPSSGSRYVVQSIETDHESRRDAVSVKQGCTHSISPPHHTETSSETRKTKPGKRRPQPLILRYQTQCQLHSFTRVTPPIAALSPSITATDKEAVTAGTTSVSTASKATTSVDIPIDSTLEPLPVISVDSTTANSVGGDRKSGSMSLRHRSSLRETETMTAMRNNVEFWGQHRGGGTDDEQTRDSMIDEDETPSLPLSRRLVLKIDKNGLAKILSMHNSAEPSLKHIGQPTAVSRLRGGCNRKAHIFSESMGYEITHELDDPQHFAAHFKQSRFPPEERARLLARHPFHRSLDQMWLIYGEQTWNLERAWNQTTARRPFRRPSWGYRMKELSTESIMTGCLVSQWNDCHKLDAEKNNILSSGPVTLAFDPSQGLTRTTAESGQIPAQCVPTRSSDVEMEYEARIGEIQKSLDDQMSRDFDEHKLAVDNECRRQSDRLDQFNVINQAPCQSNGDMPRDLDPFTPISKKQTKPPSLGLTTSVFTHELLNSLWDDSTNSSATPDREEFGTFRAKSNTCNDVDERSRSAENERVTVALEELGSANQSAKEVRMSHFERSLHGMETVHTTSNAPTSFPTTYDSSSPTLKEPSPKAPSYSSISEIDENDEYQSSTRAHLGRTVSSRRGSPNLTLSITGASRCTTASTASALFDLGKTQNHYKTQELQAAQNEPLNGTHQGASIPETRKLLANETTTIKLRVPEAKFTADGKPDVQEASTEWDQSRSDQQNTTITTESQPAKPITRAAKKKTPIAVSDKESKMPAPRKRGPRGPYKPRVGKGQTDKAEC